MSSVEMVVANVFRQQAFQVTLVERNHVIQKVATAASYPTFCHSILPWAAERSSNRSKPNGLRGLADRVSEFGITIQNQVLVLRVIREGFTQLLGNPETCRVSRNIAVKNSPTIVSDDKETIQHSESECWNGEKVHCGNYLAVILHKRLPALRRARVLRRLLNPTRNSSFCDIKPELQQFPVDAWRAPSRVLGHNTENQLSQLSADPLPAKDFPIAGEPMPIETEASSMPAHYRFGSNEDKSRLPVGPKTSRQ